MDKAINRCYLCGIKGIGFNTPKLKKGMHVDNYGTFKDTPVL